MGEVLHRAPLGHRHMTPARQRLQARRVADALPPVFVVLSQRNSGPGRQRWPGLSQQLGRGLVKADHRPSGVIRRKVQQVLHVGHELRAHLGNAPFPLLPLESVFFRRLRPLRGTWRMPASTPPPCASSSGHALPAAGCRPDQVGLAPVVQLPVPVGLGTVLQNPGQPFLGKALLDPVHCAQGHIQGFSHLGSRPTVVALEENPGPGGDSGRVFPNPNQTLDSSRCSATSRTAYLSLTITATPANNTPTKQDSPIVRFLKQLLKRLTEY